MIIKYCTIILISIYWLFMIHLIKKETGNEINTKRHFLCRDIFSFAKTFFLLQIYIFLSEYCITLCLQVILDILIIHVLDS